MDYPNVFEVVAIEEIMGFVPTKDDWEEYLAWVAACEGDENEANFHDMEDDCGVPE